MTDQSSILEQVRSGAPVEFEIDGHKFAIRQMTPAERDRLNYVEVKLRDRIMADYRAEGLDKQPVIPLTPLAPGCGQLRKMSTQR